jgi:hypothetical protein
MDPAGREAMSACSEECVEVLARELFHEDRGVIGNYAQRARHGCSERNSVTKMKLFQGVKFSQNFRLGLFPRSPRGNALSKEPHLRSVADADKLKDLRVAASPATDEAWANNVRRCGHSDLRSGGESLVFTLVEVPHFEHKKRPQPSAKLRAPCPLVQIQHSKEGGTIEVTVAHRLRVL